MKVLWFTNTPANGAEYLESRTIGGGWLESLDRYLQREVDLHVAFYYGKQTEPFRHGQTTYHPIEPKGGHYLNTAMSKLTVRIVEEEDLNKYLSIIDQVKPDIIHIHGTENPFSCIIPHVDAPCIVSIQGNITVYHHKFFSGLEKKYANTKRSTGSLKKAILEDTFLKKYKLFTKMKSRELRNFRNVRYVMGRTDWDRRISAVMAPQSEYFRGDEMLRDVFYQKQWQWPGHPDPLIIHTTNGSSFFKGFETLCEALYELNQLDIPVEWRVAGIGPNDPLVRIVKKKLGKRFPQRGLVLLGRLPADELVEKLLEAHIYVMPSHIENSPNNLCEAMILGMPCIATFAGGTGSLLDDGHEGFLIQDGDPWVMAGAVLELYKDSEKAVTLGKHARERAMKRHGRAAIAAQVLGAYQTIVKKSNGKGAKPRAKASQKS